MSWDCVYAIDKTGKVLEGSVETLIEAFERGAEFMIRQVFEENSISHRARQVVVYPATRLVLVVVVKPAHNFSRTKNGATWSQEPGGYVSVLGSDGREYFEGGKRYEQQTQHWYIGATSMPIPINKKKIPFKPVS